MTKNEVRQRILDEKIVPVVRAATPELALKASEAVCEGGITILEITMTIPGAIEVIRELSRSKHLLVGAGTVLDEDQANGCIDAGAEFIVCPGFDPTIVRLVVDADILMIAGALTPSEVIAAWKSGADFIKIFPCGYLGGAAYIKTLKAVLPQIELLPTGGVSLLTVGQFFRAGAAAVGVGSELVSASALSSGDFSNITAVTRQFVIAVKDATLVPILTDGSEQAQSR